MILVLVPVLQCRFRGSVLPKVLPGFQGRRVLAATAGRLQANLLRGAVFRGLSGPLGISDELGSAEGAFEAVETGTSGTFVSNDCDAVVKVPPPVGCVKYKAQHIVLPLQIPMFLPCYKHPPQNCPENAVEFLVGPLKTRPRAPKIDPVCPFRKQPSGPANSRFHAKPAGPKKCSVD